MTATPRLNVYRKRLECPGCGEALRQGEPPKVISLQEMWHRECWEAKVQPALDLSP